MKIKIRPIRIPVGGRAVSWYAEVEDTAMQRGVRSRETFFYRSSRQQVEALVAKLKGAEVEVMNF